MLKIVYVTYDAAEVDVGSANEAWRGTVGES